MELERQTLEQGIDDVESDRQSHEYDTDPDSELLHVSDHEDETIFNSPRRNNSQWKNC